MTNEEIEAQEVREAIVKSTLVGLGVCGAVVATTAAVGIGRWAKRKHSNRKWNKIQREYNIIWQQYLYEKGE